MKLVFHVVIHGVPRGNLLFCLQMVQHIIRFRHKHIIKVVCDIRNDNDDEHRPECFYAVVENVGVIKQVNGGQNESYDVSLKIDGLAFTNYFLVYFSQGLRERRLVVFHDAA